MSRTACNSRKGSEGFLVDEGGWDSCATVAGAEAQVTDREQAVATSPQARVALLPVLNASFERGNKVEGRKSEVEQFLMGW